jgi:hypothetical protein
MSPNDNHKPWEERLHEATVSVEEEIKRVVRYLDAEVVPEVRKNGSAALRAASEQLARLAEKIDDATRKGSS